MKKKSAKWAALLLAACMVLALAACGKKGGESQQRSGTVYVPQFMDCALEDVQYVNQGCSDGQYIYFSADIRGEEKEETWTDPETGETVEIPCDTVISAVGEKVDAEALGAYGVQVGEAGRPGFQTNLPGVYAAGDVLRGPATVVEGIADATAFAQEVLGVCVC